MRENPPGRKNGHANEEVQAGADCDVAAASRSGNPEGKDYPVSLQGSRDHPTDLLPLDERVRRTQAGSSKTTERTGKGECETQATGGGAVASIGEDWLANFDMRANYIAMGWGGSKSQTRQNSSISGLVPREHRTNFGISGIRGPSKIPFF